MRRARKIVREPHKNVLLKEGKGKQKILVTKDEELRGNSHGVRLVWASAAIALSMGST